MKTTAFVLSILLSSIVAVGFQCDAQEIRQPQEATLIGVWVPSDIPTGSMAGQMSLIINRNTIILPMLGGPFRITRIEHVGENVFGLSFYYDTGGFEANYAVHYDPDNKTIWFQDKQNTQLISSGPDHLWRKETDPFAPGSARINDSQVRLRNAPNLDSLILGFLSKGEKVQVLARSEKKQRIGDMEDFWYRVQTSDHKEGWAYGAFIDLSGILNPNH